MKKTLLLITIVMVGAFTFSACTSEQPEQTQELSTQEQTDLVTIKAVYDSYNSNLSELMDTQDSSTPEKIDAITEKAYEVTADEWGFTVDEVKAKVQEQIVNSNKLND